MQQRHGEVGAEVGAVFQSQRLLDGRYRSSGVTQLAEDDPVDVVSFRFARVAADVLSYQAERLGVMLREPELIDALQRIGQGHSPPPPGEILCSRKKLRDDC